MRHATYDVTYAAPQKNALLISCIDLRLTDDLVRFMEHDNMTNRYDQFILAGCSLAITLLEKKAWRNKEDDPCKQKYPANVQLFEAWWTTLQSHIGIAINLHDIHDIYIVEHEACGAYKAFLDKKVYKDGKDEEKCQAISAHHLKDEILKLGLKRGCPDPGTGDKPQELHIHCVRIDLRGNVKML